MSICRVRAYRFWILILVSTSNKLRKESPSHIVLPAIHLKRQDVSETFHEHLNTEKGNYDPQYLAGSARHHLRERFIESDLAQPG